MCICDYISENSNVILQLKKYFISEMELHRLYHMLHYK